MQRSGPRFAKCWNDEKAPCLPLPKTSTPMPEGIIDKLKKASIDEKVALYKQSQSYAMASPRTKRRIRALV